jgi:hypothetical protein
MDFTSPHSGRTVGNDPDQKPPSQQDRSLFWFVGLFPILTSIVTPLTLYYKVKKKPNASDIQRYNDLLQEFCRQVVSGTVGLLSYFGGGGLTRALANLMPSHKKEASDQLAEQKDQHDKMVKGGMILSFVGYGLVRPFVSTDILYLLRKSEAPQSARSTAKPLPRWQSELQHWVDRRLLAHGQPQLGKTAVLSVVSLGAYLGGLALAIYGVSRLFRQPEATSSPAPSPQSPVTAAPSPLQAARLQIAPVGMRVTPATYGQVYYRSTPTAAKGVSV